MENVTDEINDVITSIILDTNIRIEDRNQFLHRTSFD